VDNTKTYCLNLDLRYVVTNERYFKAASYSLKQFLKFHKVNDWQIQRVAEDIDYKYRVKACAFNNVTSKWALFLDADTCVNAPIINFFERSKVAYLRPGKVWRMEGLWDESQWVEMFRRLNLNYLPMFFSGFILITKDIAKELNRLWHYFINWTLSSGLDPRIAPKRFNNDQYALSLALSKIGLTMDNIKCLTAEELSYSHTGEKPGVVDHYAGYNIEKWTKSS